MRSSPSLPSLRGGRSLLFLVIPIVAALHLLGLGRAHLLEPDEGRYADVARSFLDGGSLVVPRADGVPFLDKPPLVPWLGAVSMRALGESAFALRLVPALAGMLAASVAAAFAHACYRRGAWAAALVYGTAPLALAVGRTFTLDVPLTASTGLGVFLILRGAGVLGDGRSHLLGILGGFALGLATLVKGPVALGLGGMALVAAAIFSPTKRLLSPLPWLAALAVSAPWYVLVCREEPDFARAFFLEENLRRFAGAPTEHVHGTFFFVGTLGWALGGGSLAGLVLLGTVPPIPRPARVLVAWAALVVGFFSLSSTKVETYILPVFPALAAAIGGEIDIALEEREGPVWRGLRATFFVLVAAIPLAALGFSAIGLGLVPLPGEHAAVIQGAVSPGLALLPLLGAAAALAAAARARPHAAVLSLGLAVLLALPAALLPIERASYLRSSEPVADLIAASGRPSGEKVASYHFYYRGLPFFLGRPVTLLGELNELRVESFASRPELFMPDLYLTFRESVIIDDCWTRAFLAWERPVLVVMPKGQDRPGRFKDACRRAGVEARLLGELGDDVLYEVVK